MRKAIPVVTGEASKQEGIDGGALEEDVEKENYENGLPRKDNKGTIIPESIWYFAITHRNYACPCGSGKKYKRCHGAE